MLSSNWQRAIQLETLGGRLWRRKGWRSETWLGFVHSLEDLVLAWRVQEDAHLEADFIVERCQIFSN